MATESPAPAKPASSGRIRCIDWLRGLAVFDMIMWHSAGLLKPEHNKNMLGTLAGLVAPSFLFAAGFAIALVMIRASGDAAARRRRATKSLQRILEVLVVAFLLRLVTRSGNDPHWLIRIDILSTIAWSLLAAFPLMYWGASRPGLTSILFAILGLSFCAAWSYTPAGFAPAGCPPEQQWEKGWEGVWGNFIQPGSSDFAPIPWSGLVFLGAAAGGLASMGLVGVSLVFVFGTGVLFWCFAWHWTIGNMGERLIFFGGGALALYALEREANDKGWKLAHPPISWLELVGTSALTAYVAHIWLLYVGLPAWPFGSLSFSYWQAWGAKLEWAQYWIALLSLWVLTMGICWGWPRLSDAVKARWRPAAKG